jgi:arylsulfatase A-like enzyme
MRTVRNPALATVAVLVAAAAGRCHRTDVARLTRLDGALGPELVMRLPPPGVGTAPRELGGRPDVTRPALALRPGEMRAATLALSPGSRLVFATGLSLPPRSGAVRLVVEVNARPIWRGSLDLDATYRWTPVTVPLPSAATATLVVRADMGSAAFAAGDAPLVLVGSPRLEAGRRLAPERVLVWISIDTLRADHLGLYGHRLPVSPTLDALGSQAVVFDNAVAPAPWTLPSLASQFTSRLPSFHGAVSVAARRDRRFASVFDVLAREGFTVLAVTANRYVSPDFGLADGFDALHFTGADAGRVNNLAESALGGWSAGDLALFVHYMDPHHPYDAPDAWRQRFVRGDYQGSADGKTFFELPASGASPDDIQHVAALYDAEVAYTDDRVGALLDALRRRGLLERAVVVVSADHGEAFLDHGRWLHGHTLYEELLHVPLIVRAPGLAPRRVRAPVSLVDLAPTLLDLLGLPRPLSFQGRSLVPLMRGGDLEPAPILAETDIGRRGDVRKVAVRLGSHKLLAHSAVGERGTLSGRGLQLFDLDQDPRELHPLPRPLESPLFREAVAYLRRARDEGSSGTPTDLEAETLESLRALGYVQYGAGRAR